ncbi:SDR family oxidoreductase [Rhodococcus globerulus]|uniref:SDR family oxidoreductase n=1 Tax=Rhodococcus globerulus TaxID=33008 RepID=UPI000526C5A8|nr:SDR family oxidoreductase [Rhodococcus globerulus]PVX59577.1 3-oxoacyl-[acyl-carrier protein] reductase [Rhodococcus globerulus]
MRFTNNTAIVTGAAGGIGAAVAQRLADEGAKVAVVDLSVEAGKSTVESIVAAGGIARAFSADVTTSLEAENCVDAVKSAFGSVDILVTCAGILRDNLVFKTSDDDWNAVIATHLTGTFNFARAAQRVMVSQKYGKLVFFSSDSARGSRGQTNYSAAKAGIEGMMRTLALELGRFGINVNAVAPGFVETAMTRATAERLGVTYEEFVASSAEKVALQRVSTPQDIAGVVAFLASEDARMVTGQTLSVRGAP